MVCQTSGCMSYTRNSASKHATYARRVQFCTPLVSDTYLPFPRLLAQINANTLFYVSCAAAVCSDIRVTLAVLLPYDLASPDFIFETSRLSCTLHDRHFDSLPWFSVSSYTLTWVFWVDSYLDRHTRSRHIRKQPLRIWLVNRSPNSVTELISLAVAGA